MRPIQDRILAFDDSGVHGGADEPLLPPSFEEGLVGGTAGSRSMQPGHTRGRRQDGERARIAAIKTAESAATDARARQ